MSHPVVSVVMPVFNSAATLAQAIESARTQTLSNIEIIAYDDCSTDHSVALLHKFAAEEPRLKVLQGTRNIGPAGARNRAIEAATGTWISVLDSDDWMASDRLEQLVTAATKRGLDVIYDNQSFYDNAAKSFAGFAIKPGEQVADLPLRTFLANSITGWSRYDYGLFNPTLLRAFLINNGIRYPEDMRYGEDFIFQLHCFTAGAKCGLFHKPLYVVRQPLGSRSGILSRPDRTPYNYDNMVVGTKAALQGLKNLHPIDRKLLELRIHSIVRYSEYLTVKSDLPRSAAVLRLSGAPSLWPYMVRAVLRRLAN